MGRLINEQGDEFMTNKAKPSEMHEQYRFVLSDDTWDEVLEIYRHGVKRPVATVRYWEADDLSESLVRLFAKTPALLASCQRLLAALKTDLKSNDPKIRFQAAKEYELRGGLRKAIAIADAAGRAA